MKKKHINIPIFIPHLGCPNHCVFCNQRSISGKSSFEESGIREEIERALSTVRKDQEAEIAFFGGSFTGIDRGLMIRLLETAQDFIRERRVASIRLSTRPDYISEEILSVLSKYEVRCIELGIQSMDDRVLNAAKRGHTVRDSETACRLIREYGFSLVGQMMTGLPYSTPEAERMTAERICELGAEGARIYPTMVFRATELEDMVHSGEYCPPELDDAISRTAGALEVFADAGVPVIRIGLHSGEALYSEEGISFGVYHPAMGELVEGELYYWRIGAALLDAGGNTAGKNVTVMVPKGELSKAVGQHGRNRKRLENENPGKEFAFREKDGMEKYRVLIKFG